MREPLLDRMRRRAGHAGAGVYPGVLSLLVLAVAGLVGLLTHLPWLFPSLGPTDMLFFESPRQRAARPGNALVGHGVGLSAGVACLYGLGPAGQRAATVGGLTPGFVIAGALSVTLTTLVLTVVNMPHPPAGATTLIVSLGIFSTAAQLLSLAGAILLITLLGWGLNFAFGTSPSPS